MRIALLIFLTACSCGAQSVQRAVHRNPAKAVASHVWHYTATHKEVIAQSLMWDLALSADAASSIHCQAYAGCYETNPLLGAHPTPGATWHWAEIGGGIVTASLFTFHWATSNQGDDAFERHLWWVPVGAFDGFEVQNVLSNVHVAQSLQPVKPKE